MKTDHEVLEQAIDLISRDGGWCKGDYCQKHGEGIPLSLEGLTDLTSVSFCIEGALRYAAGHELPLYDPEVADQIGRLYRAVSAAGRTGDGVFDLNLPRHFNDDPRTSQEDAILALKTALADLP